MLAHLLILAAILSAPSQIRKALLEETDPFQIALALVLIGMNALLYTWVSVSNPGIVNAESNAKRAARAAQQAAANTASTTAAQLASGNANRLDALYVPRASSVSSMGASSAISGTVGAKVNGFATPACVTTASPSTNTPTSAVLFCTTFYLHTPALIMPAYLHKRNCFCIQLHSTCTCGHVACFTDVLLLVLAPSQPSR